ncbi:MAG: hypothetical protein NTX33_11305 [Propionibacteriales bacterium]|nr:hypothetical protein [Propionibacteriales bacterium]
MDFDGAARRASADNARTAVGLEQDLILLRSRIVAATVWLHQQGYHGHEVRQGQVLGARRLGRAWLLGTPTQADPDKSSDLTYDMWSMGPVIFENGAMSDTIHGVGKTNGRGAIQRCKYLVAPLGIPELGFDPVGRGCIPARDHSGNWWHHAPGTTTPVPWVPYFEQRIASVAEWARNTTWS